MTAPTLNDPRAPGRRAHAAALVLWLLLAGLVGCGDDASPHETVPTGRRDPKPDAGPEPDAGEPIEHDAGFADRTPGHACEVDPDALFDLSVSKQVPDVAPLGVQSVAGYFGMAYVDQSETCVDALYVAELRGGKKGGGPMVSSAVDQCSQIDRVALASLDRAWLVATVDNREPPSDIWVQVYAADSSDAPKAQRVTDTPALERSVTLSVVSEDAAMLAWVERDVDSGVETLKVRPLDGQGKPTAEAVSLPVPDGSSITLPSMAPIGSFVGLAYHRGHPDGQSEVVLERLDPASGERTRDPWVVTDQAGPQPSVGLTRAPKGGAILYSTVAGGSGRQLWFQRLDERVERAPVMSGAVVGGQAEPQRLVNSPFRAIDASIEKLSVGYAVAYRGLPGGTLEEPAIKLLFLEENGRIVGDSVVAPTSETGGRTSVAFSIEGRMVMGWSDHTDEGTRLRMMRVPCVGDG